VLCLCCAVQYDSPERYQLARALASDSPVKVRASSASISRPPPSPISDISDSSILLAGYGRCDQPSSGCTSPSSDIGRGYASEPGKRESDECNASSRKSRVITLSDSELKANVTVQQEYLEPNIGLSSSSGDASSPNISRPPLSKTVLGRGTRLSEVLEKKRSSLISPVGSGLPGAVRSIGSSIGSPQELSPQPEMSDKRSPHSSSLGYLSESGNVSANWLGQSELETKMPDNVYALHQRSSHDRVEVSSGLTTAYQNSGSHVNQPYTDDRFQMRKPALGRGASFQDVLDKKHALKKVAVGNTSSGPALEPRFTGSLSSLSSPRPSVQQLSPSNQQPGTDRPSLYSPRPSVQQLAPSDQHLNQQHHVSPLLNSQKSVASPVLVTARLPKSARMRSSSKDSITDSSPRISNQSESVSSGVQLPVVASKEVERSARY